MFRGAFFLFMLMLMGCKAQLVNQVLQGDNNNEIAYTIGGKGEALVLIHAGGLDKEM